ncbi:MAG TPA: hypothetical protein DIS66_01880 [Candidatus Omnitrophica bacterium]|nr:hypothetical protein [Candidatus Omnitrophota bacterium]
MTACLNKGNPRMLCACGKKEATIHLTEIVNGQVTEIHLCDLCSKDHGADFKQFLAPLQAGLPDLAGMFSKAMGLAPGQDMKCEACGMTMRDFEKAGRLGCAGCYDTFAPYLLPLIKRIHRHDQHLGKTVQVTPVGSSPVAVKTKASGLTVLKKKLNECIKQEAYEDAAKLRDEIQKYQKVGAKKSSGLK